MGLVGRGIYKKKKGWLQKTKTLGPLPPKLKVKQVPQMRNSPNVYIRPSKDHLDLAFTRDEQVFFQTKPNAEMPTAWYFDPKLLRWRLLNKSNPRVKLHFLANFSSRVRMIIRKKCASAGCHSLKWIRKKNITQTGRKENCTRNEGHNADTIDSICTMLLKNSNWTQFIANLAQHNRPLSCCCHLGHVPCIQ